MASSKLKHTVLIKYKGKRPRQFIGEDGPANEWCMENAGMVNYSWKHLHHYDYQSGGGYVVYYFKDPLIATMFKLTWGNQ